MLGPVPVCLAGPQGPCVHYKELDPDTIIGDENGMRCDAFPDGIPDEVLVNGNPHTTDLPGDSGIHYEGSNA